jgi:hypothetical protein
MRILLYCLGIILILVGLFKSFINYMRPIPIITSINEIIIYIGMGFFIGGLVWKIVEFIINRR